MNGNVAVDPGELIQDVLWLRSERATGLYERNLIPEVDKAVSILVAAQSKSWNVFGEEHNIPQAEA
jgi:hypothetical protein